MNQTVKLWMFRGVVGLMVVLVALVGAPWVYINVIKDDAPEVLSLESVSTSLPVETSLGGNESELEGVWQLGSDSVVGY